MTACDDKIERLTTTLLPANERRVRMTTMATATARWAAARWDMMAMAMATCNDNNNNNDDGATTTTMTTMATARRATGYGDDGNDDGGSMTGEGIQRRWRQQWWRTMTVTTMTSKANARRATKSTMMVTARRATTMASGATGYDEDNDGDE